MEYTYKDNKKELVNAFNQNDALFGWVHDVSVFPLFSALIETKYSTICFALTEAFQELRPNELIQKKVIFSNVSNIK